MHKRGRIEVIILVLVLVIAIAGLYFIFKGSGRATGYNFDCIVECQPPKGVEAKWFVTTSVQEAQFMCNQYANEQCRPGTRYQSVARPTGGFAVPGAKEYGGAISGVADSGQRAFTGRAYEIPYQSCYTCSCLQQGITATTRPSAERVCFDNCGGGIIGVAPGPCR